MTKGIYVYRSSVSWPTTTIMVWVHANEHTGVLALQELMNEWLQVRSGTVYCIFANLEWIKQKKRYIDVNMNRCFGRTCSGYEAGRIKEILPFLQKSDYLLDIHNTTDQSAPKFIIGERDEMYKYFDVKVAVSWLDRLHPGWSDGYMNSIGKVGLCLECGSIIDDTADTVPFAKYNIVNFLKATSNLAGNPKTYQVQQKLCCDEIYTTKNWPFKLIQSLKEFEQVKAWQLIGYDGAEKVIVTRDAYILFARNTIARGEECFVLSQKVNPI